MRRIKTWRDPYGAGFNTCRLKEVVFVPGLTVLVGCNGAGKTTMLKNIKQELKDTDIPVYMFNNLHDGGSNSIGEMLQFGSTSFAANMICSSEGENINNNLAIIASKLQNFIDNGFVDDPYYRFSKIFKDDEEEKELGNERWILLDAIDSGLSVDNIVDAKDFFNTVINDGKSKGIDVYIIVSANEYELANGEQCFDVMNGHYIEFFCYDDYRKFILRSREKKDRRYE